MSTYTYDTFLNQYTDTDTTLQIVDTDGVVKFTINPYSILTTMISNNLLTFKIKSGRLISIPFSTMNESMLALISAEERIQLLINKTPNFIDKQVEKYSEADLEAFNSHLTDPVAHADLFTGKENKSEKGVINGYVPLNEFRLIASEFLNIVNDLISGGTTALLSAEQGKLLQTQIDDINILLSSDNINLDTVQELVDAIETVQISLSTILVNDLATGGTTKALTAEMGKLLHTNKVDKVAGERLINAAEITKLAGLSNVVTTVRTILSTALATQDIAGFVTYINTLDAPLVVGANEIVEYKTSDTGRVFKLLLRGRSFGVGQPAIVAADVLESTEFLNNQNFTEVTNTPKKTVSLTVPSGVPNDGDEWILYTL